MLVFNFADFRAKIKRVSNQVDNRTVFPAI